MARIEAGMAKGTGNVIYNSPYRDLAWMWLQDGQTPTAVQQELLNHGMKVSLPVVYNFQKLMTEIEENRRNSTTAGLPLDGATIEESVTSVYDVPEEFRIKNDSELLDLIIMRFMNQVKDGRATITVAAALKAIEMKKSMLGAKYKGQTVWSLMESQMQIDKLLEVMNKHITHDQFEAIVSELEGIGVVTTKRPEALGTPMNIDSELSHELVMSDPTQEVYDDLKV